MAVITNLVDAMAKPFKGKDVLTDVVYFTVLTASVSYLWTRVLRHVFEE